jgi:hypothetical protein
MMKRFFAIFLSAAACGGAEGAWTTTYEGENAMSLVTRPNSAGSNSRRALIDVRHLPEGSYTQTLAPIVDAALKGCAMDDVRKIVMKAQTSPDRIGNTTTHISGPGIYVNLPSADRVGIGNWYLAPFYSISVELSGDNGPLESFELFEYEQDILETDRMTQERFLQVKDDDVELSIVTYARRTLPAAVKKALPKRCK